jgi:hypothetical protein
METFLARDLPAASPSQPLSTTVAAAAGHAQKTAAAVLAVSIQAVGATARMSDRRRPPGCADPRPG